MRKLHVLMKKEELDGQRLDGKIVIVLDILFATTTIVAAGMASASASPCARPTASQSPARTR